MNMQLRINIAEIIVHGVKTEFESRPAISFLVSPSFISSKTSRSRSVRPKSVFGPAMRVNISRTEVATRGDMGDPPAIT